MDNSFSSDPTKVIIDIKHTHNNTDKPFNNNYDQEKGGEIVDDEVDDDKEKVVKIADDEVHYDQEKGADTVNNQ